MCVLASRAATFPRWIALVVAGCGWLASGASAAAPLAQWDLTTAADAALWQHAPHDSRFRAERQGLIVDITGEDPYFHGPVLTLPTNQLLRLELRLNSETGGIGQIFALLPGPKYELLADFNMPRGQWRDVRIDLPALPSGTRLRLDPPGTSGLCQISALRLETRQELPPPRWPAWRSPEAAPGPGLTNAALELLPHPRSAQTVELRVLGRPMAFVNLVPRIAWWQGDALRWTDIAPGTRRAGRRWLEGESRWQDEGGAAWRLKSRFTLEADRVDVEAEVEVNQDRQVSFLPLLTVFAGDGSFGAQKKQGLFAGLEYLDNEPSSSELDILGPASRRQVPPSYQITAPLMAVQADGRYLGLVWDDTRRVSALYDSPDRTFGSGGHVMGVIWPESDGDNRSPGSLVARYPATLRAGQPLRLRASLIAGAGDSVVPAIQHFVRLRPLPALPNPGNTLPDYAALMAHGWLRSKVRVGDRYRHAWAGEHFQPGPAADAAVFETWLAQQTPAADAATELRNAAAAAALGQVRPNDYYASGVGHIRTPDAALLFGKLPEAIAAARATARSALSQFDAEGRVIYHQAPDRPDFGKGHFAPDANGLTATVLARLLDAAAFCGDPELIARGVAILRQQDHFHGTVPRGAQTWELALHTPDILASAYLVRDYLTGYQLTGDRHFLDEAAYWAWTGVPFVYLVNPTGQPIGPYATIAVYGATHWKAPNWMGLPVQWCGLVYADALYRLAALDTSGPWRKLADGITVSGVQQTYPLRDADRGGLLPDSFVLQAQHRNPADINPATLGVCAVRFYTGNPLYDFCVLREAGLRVHAPGLITPISSAAGAARFTVAGWPRQPFFVLVNGVPRPPVIRVNGKSFPLAAPSEYRAADGCLILQLPGGEAKVELTF